MSCLANYFYNDVIVLYHNKTFKL